VLLELSKYDDVGLTLSQISSVLKVNPPLVLSLLKELEQLNYVGVFRNMVLDDDDMDNSEEWYLNDAGREYLNTHHLLK
jgi:hypothetical protein